MAASTLLFRLPGPAAQRGAALAGFVVSLPVLLLAGLAVIEAAYWHITRQVLDVALLEAARAGATAHGRPQAMATAFEAALRPLPTGRARWRRIHDDSGAPAWRIDILAPPAAAYADFGVRGLAVPHGAGTTAIRNDYQAEEHARRRAKGWPEGRGPASGMTIFEANVLRLRLSYQLPPLTPIVRALLRALAPAGDDALRASAARAGNVLIVHEMALEMQSHPAAWPRRRIEPG
ncbi:TadE/TadG family type IV pilus assembly protein [Achromobacter aloeverae]